MVVAFDIDDTINRYPEFFAFLTRVLKSAGHEVLILTFRQDRAGAEADLRAWGIVWNKLVTATTEACLVVGVDHWKAAECLKAGVQVFFEDDEDVLRHVDRKTFCLQPYVPGE